VFCVDPGENDGNMERSQQVFRLFNITVSLILIAGVAMAGDDAVHMVHTVKEGELPAMDLPESLRNPVPETARANGYWRPLMQSDFELYWPYDWSAYSEFGYTDCYWGNVSCRSWSGSWSIHCSNDGSAAPTATCDSYVNGMSTVMKFGPFDLSNASAGYMTFYTLLDLEDTFDSFYYLVSTDDVGYYGVEMETDTSGWENRSLDFASVPTLGSVLGESAVWIAFRFTSDASFTEGEGAYVDDVEVWIESAIPGTVRLVMPDTYFAPGDFFWLDAWYSEATDPDRMPLFVILEAFGSYYMAPSFTPVTQYFEVDPSENLSVIAPIPNFYWPTGAGNAYGLKWHAALTDLSFSTLRSNIATWEFDYGN